MIPIQRTANSTAKSLITETKARAKDFLRLSQLELNSVLERLKGEYTAIILDFGWLQQKRNSSKLYEVLSKQAELPPLPEGWENRVGMKLSASVSIL
jgi:hypothetical protein